MADRSERMLNLLALLKSTPRALTLDEIAEKIGDYPEPIINRRRQFERDKEELRKLGVPIALETLDAITGEQGYRIRSADYEMPDPGLTDDERIALNLAVSAVRLEGTEGEQALQKLGGIEATAQALASVPSAPGLARVFEGYRDRRRVRFAYRGKARDVDPYGVLLRDGHWYLTGHDHGHGELRIFRLDRIDGTVEVTGPPDAFARPDGFRPSEVLSDEPWAYGDEQPVDALIRIEGPSAYWAERDVGAEHVVARDADGVVFRVTVRNPAALRNFVLGFLDHAEVLEPPALRDEMVAWLDAIVAGAQP